MASTAAPHYFNAEPPDVLLDSNPGLFCRWRGDALQQFVSHSGANTAEAEFLKN
jgi:hypothetical protein